MKKSNKKLLSFGSRTFVLTAAIIVIIGGVISGTVAWMFIKSDPVHNTFSYGDMKIELTETTGVGGGEEGDGERTYSMTPVDSEDPDAGIAKDPTITVTGGTVDCWVFVEVKKSDNFDEYMEYALADGWSKLDGENGIYYREVLESAEMKQIPVLADNKVKVKSDVTQAQLDAMEEKDYPTIEFTAYAVQKSDVDSPKEAWKVARGK